MTVERPQTLAEWRTYAATLSGEPLRRVAIAANTTSFVAALQDEGYDAADIHRVLALIARRFVDTGQRPPGDGLYDLEQLLATAPP